MIQKKYFCDHCNKEVDIICKTASFKLRGTAIVYDQQLCSECGELLDIASVQKAKEAKHADLFCPICSEQVDRLNYVNITPDSPFSLCDDCLASIESTSADEKGVVTIVFKKELCNVPKAKE